MVKHNAISREARKHILDKVFERGETTIDEVVEEIDPLYEFDAQRAREREVANYARRILASAKSSDGVRTVLAVEGEPGQYVNIETCRDPVRMKKVTAQLDRKWKGIGRTRTKARRTLAQLEGQLSLFDTVHDKEARASL